MFQLTSEEISLRPHMAEVLVPPCIADLYRDGTEVPVDSNSDEAKPTGNGAESTRAESKNVSDVSAEMSKMEVQENSAAMPQNVRQASVRGETGSVKADEN